MTLSNLFLISSIFAFILTPIGIFLAKKFRFLDFPWRAHPAILHERPIPRAGGLPTYLAIILTYLGLLALGILYLDKHIVGVLVAGALVVIVGILDDKYDLNPYLRLFTNFLAAAIIVGSGVGISWITNPFGGQIRLDEIIIRFNFPAILPFDFFAGPHSIILLADIFAFLWIIWVMNALNWSSGVDGQLSGVVAIGLAAVGIASAQYVSYDHAQMAVAALSFIAAGAYFGFLPWSFYPQKIMPGYGGATLGGMLLATLGILAGAKLATITLILIVPMIDGVWAILRRLLAGRSPVWGDREHLHHQLLELGWKKWQVAIFYYLLVGAFAFLALSLDHRGRFFAISLGGMLILAALVTTAYFVKRLKNAK